MGIGCRSLIAISEIHSLMLVEFSLLCDSSSTPCYTPQLASCLIKSTRNNALCWLSKYFSLKLNSEMLSSSYIIYDCMYIRNLLHNIFPDFSSAFLIPHTYILHHVWSLYSISARRNRRVEKKKYKDDTM